MNHSCEQSEHCTNSTKAEILNKYFNKTSKKFTNLPYYNAVTIRLNTHPSKKDGITNEETVFQALNYLIGEDAYYESYCWEMTSGCQLHLHALVLSQNQIYRKDSIAATKKKFGGMSKYSIYIQAIKRPCEVDYWRMYMKKAGDLDPRPLYYRLIQFYHNPDLIVEDFEDLADYDIEFNRNTGHFQFIDSSKVKAWETTYKNFI